jgi:hypothetical protein
MHTDKQRDRQNVHTQQVCMYVHSSLCMHTKHYWTYYVHL